MELFEYPLRQILATPAHDTVNRRDRAASDDLGKSPALDVVELGRLARRLPVDQTIGAVPVETQNPVANNLQTNITDPRRIKTFATIVNLGQRKQPSALSGICRKPGQSTQNRTIKIIP